MRECGEAVLAKAMDIAKEAEDRPADSIASGTHGRRGFGHPFLGSVAERVVRVAAEPALLVRGK